MTTAGKVAVGAGVVAGAGLIVGALLRRRGSSPTPSRLVADPAVLRTIAALANRVLVSPSRTPVTQVTAAQMTALRTATRKAMRETGKAAGASLAATLIPLHPLDVISAVGATLANTNTYLRSSKWLMRGTGSAWFMPDAAPRLIEWADVENVGRETRVVEVGPATVESYRIRLPLCDGRMVNIPGWHQFTSAWRGWPSTGAQAANVAQYTIPQRDAARNASCGDRGDPPRTVDLMRYWLARVLMADYFIGDPSERYTAGWNPFRDFWKPGVDPITEAPFNAAVYVAYSTGPYTAASGVGVRTMNGDLESWGDSMVAPGVIFRYWMMRRVIEAVADYLSFELIAASCGSDGRMSIEDLTTRLELVFGPFFTGLVAVLKAKGAIIGEDNEVQFGQNLRFAVRGVWEERVYIPDCPPPSGFLLNLLIEKLVVGAALSVLTSNPGPLIAAGTAALGQALTDAGYGDAAGLLSLGAGMAAGIAAGQAVGDVPDFNGVIATAMVGLAGSIEGAVLGEIRAATGLSMLDGVEFSVEGATVALGDHVVGILEHGTGLLLTANPADGSVSLSA